MCLNYNLVLTGLSAKEMWELAIPGCLSCCISATGAKASHYCPQTTCAQMQIMVNSQGAPRVLTSPKPAQGCRKDAVKQLHPEQTLWPTMKAETQAQSLQLMLAFPKNCSLLVPQVSQLGEAEPVCRDRHLRKE